MNMSVDSRISEINDLFQKNGPLTSVTDVLKDLTNMMKSDNFKSKLSSDSWNTIMKVTIVAHMKLSKENYESEELDFLAEYLRFLRNSCGNGIIENQHFILSCNEILDCVKKTVNIFKQKKSEKEVIVLKCGIQIIGNLVCLSTDAKVFVWKHFLEQNIFQSLFEHENHTVKEYTMMVLFNCMTEETAQHFIAAKEGHQILICLLDTLCNDLVDWGLLFLEYILKQDTFFQKCYAIVPLKSRLLLLDIIIQQLSCGPGNAYFIIPQSSLNYITDLFVHNVKKFVEMCDREDSDLRALEIMKLLSLLGDASVLDNYSHLLKSRRELLETSVDTLKCVHLLGKASKNAFSRISDLHMKTDIHKEEIESNPSYGFKKNLIRLIGNLCFNCRENQDIVRKLEGIPVLLDCCNIDARNPFIMQWSLLALRNIMEKNHENQAFLAAVSATGEVDKAVFAELGFEAKKEDGKYIIRSVQSHQEF